MISSMYANERRTCHDQSRGENAGPEIWQFEQEVKDGRKPRSPLIQLAIDHVENPTPSEELNDALTGVKAALSSLEPYEFAVRMPCFVPKFHRHHDYSTIHRGISEEEVAMGRQRWSEFVVDLTDENLLCLSPSASVGSLTESDPPMLSTPKTSPTLHEPFHLNSAATPFVPSRGSSITELVFPSLNSPPARDDDGFITISAPVPKFLAKSSNKRRTSSKTRALVDGLRLSPSPILKAKNGPSVPSPPSSSSSPSDFGSPSERGSLADDDGWIIMEPEDGKPEKPTRSKAKSHKPSQVQPIVFPSLLPFPAKKVEKVDSKDDDGWIEWPSLNSSTSLPPAKSRHSKSRSAASPSSGRGHNRRVSAPAPPPLTPAGFFFTQTPIYHGTTPYVYHGAFQTYPAMVPTHIPVPVVAVPVPPTSGWMMYPPA